MQVPIIELTQDVLDLFERALIEDDQEARAALEARFETQEEQEIQEHIKQMDADLDAWLDQYYPE